MKAFRFETKVSKKGIIHIPDFLKLKEKEVEITIRSKQKDTNKKITASEFIDKWAGFLNNLNTDQSKLDYLSKKYR